jgi:hypothetical protein
MILTLAFHPGDISQTLRLMKWMGFLSSKNANSLQDERLLLVVSAQASIHSSCVEIVNLARSIFQDVHTIVPDEHECGWPGAANWMFSQALFHVEQTEYTAYQDDMLWFEPDAVPLTPNWLDILKEEWTMAQLDCKTFMGARVDWDIPHMTGVGVYGKAWRKHAPSLVNCPDTEALAAARITPLIQHVFRHHDKGWSVPGLSILDKRAVIFHQDKKGKLIQMLDQSQYSGECAADPVWRYDVVYSREKVTARFFHCVNATKPVKINGNAFTFERLESFAGSLPGALATELEHEQNLLAAVACNPASGVTEITKDDWERETKRKWQV